MIYNNELILVDSTKTKDEIGQEIKTETYTSILCSVKSIGRNEFYAAAKAGLNPSIVFIIHKYEYSGQLKVQFENQNYKVLRTYATTFEETELVCERIGSNG